MEDHHASDKKLTQQVSLQEISEGATKAPNHRRVKSMSAERNESPKVIIQKAKIENSRSSEEYQRLKEVKQRLLAVSKLSENPDREAKSLSWGPLGLQPF